MLTLKSLAAFPQAVLNVESSTPGNTSWMTAKLAMLKTSLANVSRRGNVFTWALAVGGGGGLRRPLRRRRVRARAGGSGRTARRGSGGPRGARRPRRWHGRRRLTLIAGRRRRCTAGAGRRGDPATPGLERRCRLVGAIVGS